MYLFPAWADKANNLISCDYMLRIVSQQNKNKNISIQILFTAVNLMERLFQHEKYMSNSLRGNFKEQTVRQGAS